MPRRSAGAFGGHWIGSGRSARDEVGVELGYKLVRKRVRDVGFGDRVEPLDDGEAVAHLAHDDRDRGLERLRYRRENLRAGLFLAALHLTEVAERNARLARDLAKGEALLLTEVTENVTDFLS